MAITLNTKPGDFADLTEKKKPTAAPVIEDEPAPTRTNTRQPDGIDNVRGLKDIGYNGRGDTGSPYGNALEGAQIVERMQRRSVKAAAREKSQKRANDAFESKRSSSGQLPIGARQLDSNASDADRDKYISRMTAPDSGASTQAAANADAFQRAKRANADAIKRGIATPDAQIAENRRQNGLIDRGSKEANRAQLQEKTMQRMANPNRRAVGQQTKVETTDGITLWDKNNRQDADMTKQDRSSAISERLDRANQGEAKMHNVRRSVGADGQVHTTSEGRPVETIDEIGLRGVSGIYGTGKQLAMSKPRPGQKQEETSPKVDAFKTSATETTPAQNGQPVAVPASQQVVAQKKTGDIPVPAVGHPVDTTNANTQEVKGYSTKESPISWNNTVALQQEAERQEARKHASSPEGIAQRQAMQKMQDDLTLLPREAWKASGQIGQAVVDGASSAGSAVADAFTRTKDFLSNPDETRRFAERFGKVKQPATVASR